jgi:nucleoredoxin
MMNTESSAERIVRLQDITLFDNQLNEFKFEDLGNIQLFGLFITGSWCPPCKEFEKVLLDFYKEVNTPEKIFEVVYMSSEKNETEFKESIKDLPWAIIKYNNTIIHHLSTELKVEYIPILYIISKNGDVLTDEGRKDILDNKEKAFESWIRILKAFKDRLDY